jgi:hypothetical protein
MPDTHHAPGDATGARQRAPLPRLCGNTAHDARGEIIRGERVINPEEARIVERIFREFASGKSPKAIANALNAEGVPAPTETKWGGPRSTALATRIRKFSITSSISASASGTRSGIPSRRLRACHVARGPRRRRRNLPNRARAKAAIQPRDPARRRSRRSTPLVTYQLAPTAGYSAQAAASLSSSFGAAVRSIGRRSATMVPRPSVERMRMVPW